MCEIFFNVNKNLNLCGLLCPEPIMIIRKTIREMQEGKILFVITDDLATIHDIPIFCSFMNHTLLIKITDILPYRFFLKKGKNFNT